jgi:hypothetical protein
MKRILDYGAYQEVEMKINKFNKKLVNKLMLGSFLFGSSASIITQVQAASTLSQGKQSVHQYNKEATEQLRAFRLELAPVEKWIKLVDRENGADPNEQVGELVPLEEAILSRSPKAVNVFIQHGADIHKVSKKVKDIYKDGFTPLHFALLSPQEMKEFCQYKNIDKVKPAPQTLHGRLLDMHKQKYAQLLRITEPDTPPKQPLLDPYASKEIVEALLYSLEQNSSSLKRYVNNSYTRINKQGQTERIKPLDLAIESRDKGPGSHPELRKEIWDAYTSIIKLLLEHGAEYNEKHHARLAEEIAEIQRQKGH